MTGDKKQLIMSRKSHWDNVYQTKSPQDVGWTQDVPEPSLRMIRMLKLPKSAGIIDIGGGDSRLVEFLLDEGYTDITVLDISGPGIERAKKRLGKRAELVNWIVSDILDFKPERTYELWHDRASFHFLTQDDQVKTYKKLTAQAILSNLVIGTFSVDGPTMCSGLNIKQYDEDSMSEVFAPAFSLKSSFREDHITPSGNAQNFVFGVFSLNT